MGKSVGETVVVCKKYIKCVREIIRKMMRRMMLQILFLAPLMFYTALSNASIITDVTDTTTSSHLSATTETMIDQTVDMNWTAPVFGDSVTLSNYRYRFSTQSNASFSDVVSGTYLSAGNTSITSATLTDSNNWYFYIVAVGSDGIYGTVQQDGPFIVDTTPEVQSVEDADGNRTGSSATAQTLTILGSKFMENVTVSLGGTLLEQVTRNSSTQITATVPSGFTPSSQMSVQVTNTSVSKSGASQDSNSQYTVTAANNNPTITTVTANGATSSATAEISSGTGTASISLLVDATDSDGDQLNYSWTANDEASGTFSGGSSSNSVTYLANVATNYTFTVTVDDGNQGSATQNIVVTVNAEQNNTPVANAGLDKTGLVVGDFVDLDGSGSTDQDATDQITYLWTFDSIPLGTNATDTNIPNSETANSAFRADVAGDYVVRLKVTDIAGASSEDTMVITASIGSFDAAKSQLVVDATDVTTDVGSITVTVTPKDRNSNNLASGQSIVISSGVGTVTAPSGTTDASGSYTTTITSTATGSGTVSATVGGSPITTTESVIFSPGALSITKSTLVLIPTIASASDTLTVTVTPRDENGAEGNLLSSGQDVVIKPNPSISSSGGIVESNGSYQQIFVMGTQDVTFTASVNSTTISASDTVTYSASAPSGSLSTITIDSSDNLVADDSNTRSISVVVNDSSSVAISNKLVTITSTDPSDTIDAVNATTDTSGTARFTVKTAKAGSKTYTATITDGSDQVVVSQTVQATFIAGTASSIVASSGGGDSAAVGSTLTAPFVTTVTDANGNVVSGATVNFSVLPDGTGTSLSATLDTTNSSGDASTTLTLGQTSGIYTVTAQLGSTDASTTFSVTAIPGAVELGASSNTTMAVGLTSSATAATYNLAVTEQVKIWITPKDSFGNLLEDNSLDVRVSSTTLNGGSLSSSTATYDATAKAYYVELSAPAISGSSTNLVSTINSVSVGKSVAVTYVPGAVSASKTTISADKSTIVVGETTATITVIPKDLEGNAIGAGQTVKVTTTTGMITGQGDATGTIDVQAVNDATDNTKYTVVLSGVDASDSDTANITVKVVSNGTDTLIDATGSVQVISGITKTYSLVKNASTTSVNAIGFIVDNVRDASDNSIIDAKTLYESIINCDGLSRWDFSTQSYISFIPGPDLNNFSLVAGEAYFISVSANSSLTLIGAPSTVSYSLQKNTSGTSVFAMGLRYGTTTSGITNAAGLYSSISNIDGLSYWDTMSQSYISFIPGPNINNVTLEDGAAYFVSVSSATTW